MGGVSLQMAKVRAETYLIDFKQQVYSLPADYKMAPIEKNLFGFEYKLNQTSKSCEKCCFYNDLDACLGMSCYEHNGYYEKLN